MKTLREISDVIRARLRAMGVTQQSLGERTGLSRRTLTGVLNGDNDFKITTLLSILDRLGYELVFVPKGAATGLPIDADFTPTAPLVKTRVQLARERLGTVAAVEEPDRSAQSNTPGRSRTIRQKSGEKK